MFLMPVMGMGGSERLVHSLVQMLDRERFNPSVAWLCGKQPLEEFKKLNVPLFDLPKKRRIDLGLMRRLADVIDREGIDVVSAQHFMPAVYAFYGCNWVAKRALIFTAHSRWEIEDTPLKWRIAGGFLLRRMAAAVGVAPEVSEAIRKIFRTSKQKTVTIENGVDTEMFAGEGHGESLRSELGLAEDELVIGTVGNLKEVKNQKFLLKAFAGIAHQYAKTKLLIVGRGFAGERDNVEQQLRSFVMEKGLSGRVVFAGYRTDVANLLGVMDVFCLTSVREGLPISLIEAMAARLPVVGTNVQGVREIVAPDKDGLLVELDNVAALRNALERLINEPHTRQRYGMAGREKVVNRYSLLRCVQAYEQLFLAVTDQGGGN